MPCKKSTDKADLAYNMYRSITFLIKGKNDDIWLKGNVLIFQIFMFNFGISGYIFFIHSCLHTLFQPFLPPAPSPPSPCYSLASRQNLFCPLLQFC
jgi:hypothetical protein